MASRYHVDLAGPVPQALAEVIRRRFGEVTIRSDVERTVMDGVIVDQSAVRALLNLLWDLGSEVRLLRVVEVLTPPPELGERRFPGQL